jgi:hypothetical protein
LRKTFDTSGWALRENELTAEEKTTKRPSELIEDRSTPKSPKVLFPPGVAPFGRVRKLVAKVDPDFAGPAADAAVGRPQQIAKKMARRTPVRPLVTALARARFRLSPAALIKSPSCLATTRRSLQFS